LAAQGIRVAERGEERAYELLKGEIKKLLKPPVPIRGIKQRKDLFLYISS
jgi:hypothetical protein